MKAALLLPSIAFLALAPQDGDRVASDAIPPAAASTTSGTASEWPQAASIGGRQYVVHQPQFESLSGGALAMSAAVELRPSDGSGADGGGEVRRGIASMTASVVPADVPGELEVHGISVRGLRFGDVDDADAAAGLSGALAGLAFTVDRATLVEDMQIVNARAAGTPGLSSTSPDFVYTEAATAIVPIDGRPRLAPVASTGWKSVRNTPFTVLVSPGGEWFVGFGTLGWMKAGGMRGSFASCAAPPAEVIAGLGSVPSLSEALGGAEPASAVQTPTQLPAKVVVVTRPTVLVSTDGAPTTSPACDGVLAATNANCTLLSTSSPGGWWTLASGRWFTAPRLEGPWSYVPPSAVPAAFANLPATPDFAAARAAVPGTTEAREAVVAATEVRTTNVKADAACKVDFNGAPAFASVDAGGAAIRYATNASQPVLEVAGAFYCCSSGAWFTSGSPTGPWSLTDRVPDPIYAIPPSCPAYPVTYVLCYGSTRDAATGRLVDATFGASAGYLGTYVVDGTTVFGTGYDYSAAAGTDDAPSDLLDGYQPAPATYGTPVAYDTQTGTYSPPAADAGYPYAWPSVQPYYLTNPWYGWGWCSGWCAGWGWGWNSWWTYNRWGWWWNHWHPYWNPAWHNDWNRDHRLFENARGQNAVMNRGVTSPWRESADWQRWNAADRAGAEPQSRESPDWQRWNAQNRLDQPAAAGRDLGAAANFARNRDYGWNRPVRANQSWNGDASRGFTRPNTSAGWGSAPRVGTSGFHPAYRSYSAPARPAVGFHGGGGGRR